ncbi:MAG TPA: class I SAM-dependent methyltransferase [Desulfomonilaceae bacterium]|nr:class I SAM-dependent methyltransferase [Desulfomonilaceae bacterium]
MDSGAKFAKIKEAVRSNFDRSPLQYQSFEDRHGFFRELNGILLAGMHVRDGADILDIGCGTAASSSHILETIPHCRVWGLDNSPAMLHVARARYQESDRLRFVEADAAKLADYFDFPFDAIIYSASIFLIPDYRESLRHAKGLLKTKGALGISFMDGVYDTAGNHLLTFADKTAGLGVSLRKPVVLSEFTSYFEEMFPLHTSWNHDFGFPETFLREFFSIPAMSAGLFPGLPYDERVRNVNILLDHLPQRQPLFRWTLMVGEKA